MRTRLIVAIVAVVVWWPALARADEVVSIDAAGEATAGEEESRTRAIDNAFALAVESVLADELTRTQLRRHRKKLRQRITRRARLYVVSYRVREQTVTEGVLRVRITARVDRRRVRQVLAELHLDKGDLPPPAKRSRPKVVVLLHATVNSKTKATFGKQGGDGGAAGQAFVSRLREQGFDVVAATGTATPVSRGAAAELPMADTAALALAEKTKAGGVFVVGVEAHSEGAIRGTRKVGAVASAVVRVIDVSGTVVGKAKVKGAGHAANAGDAAEEAARDVGTRAAGAVAPTVTKYWPAPRKLSTNGAMVVVIKGAPTWSTISAVIAKLKGSRGVTSVATRHMSRGEVVLAVTTTLKTRQIVRIVRTTKLAEGSIVAKNRGGKVEAVVYTDEDGGED